MNFIKKRIFIFLCLILSVSFCFGESQFSAIGEAEKDEKAGASFSGSKTSFVGEEIFSLGWASVNLFCAWRFIINNDSIPSFAADAYIKGFDYGIKCSFNLEKIAKKLFKKN